MNAKRIISIVLSSFILMSTSSFVNASEAADTEVAVTEEASADNSMSTFADVLVVYTRYNTDKGYWEVNIWNETRGYWIAEWTKL